MESNLKLEDGARSFYQFFSDWGGMIPALFCVIGLVLCGITGTHLYRMVEREAYGPADQSKTGHVFGFVLGALLAISPIVTYAISRIWTGV